MAICTARNAVLLALVLTALSALPAPSSAAEALSLSQAALDVPVDEGLGAEGLDVLAIFVVPFGVGALLVGLAASQYENLIDKLSGDGDRR